MSILRTFGLSVLLLFWGTISVLAGDVLDTVRKAGFVRCGVSTGVSGFSMPDDKGVYHGLDADMCRAVAAAVLGDADKVRFRTLSTKDRFTALQSGSIDMLARISTWTYRRDIALGIDFVAVNFFDGQGFLVRKDSGIERATDMNGVTVCTVTGTTLEESVYNYFQVQNLKLDLLVYEQTGEAIAAYENQRCDAFANGKSLLYSQMKHLAAPGDHKILPDVTQTEAYGVAVKQGDTTWSDIVRWSFFAMVMAEELGIKSCNVDELRKKSKNSSIQRLLGVVDNLGGMAGLPADWAYQIIYQVGNYGESFARHLGQDSSLQMTRDLNRLWKDGGLMYAPLL